MSRLLRKLVFVALSVCPVFAALATKGSALTRALAKPRPLLVHVWDPNPDELSDFAIGDVSEAVRKSGATAVLVQPELVVPVAKEQEIHRGSFPGPVPVAVDAALRDLVDSASADDEIKAWKDQGASTIGLRYYEGDWSEEGSLEDALQGVITAAQKSGLDTILLAEFGANGAEGADGSSELASRVGAAAGLTKAAEAGGAPAIGCWDGSDEELQRLRDAGFGGLILKNACRGDVAFGAKIKSPSLAAQAVTRLVKKALSKDGKAIWGGAGGVAEAKGESMDAYFNRS